MGGDGRAGDQECDPSHATLALLDIIQTACPCSPVILVWKTPQNPGTDVTHSYIWERAGCARRNAKIDSRSNNNVTVRPSMRTGQSLHHWPSTSLVIKARTAVTWIRAPPASRPRDSKLLGEGLAIIVFSYVDDLQTTGTMYPSRKWRWTPRHKAARDTDIWCMQLGKDDIQNHVRGTATYSVDNAASSQDAQLEQIKPLRY